MVSVQTKELGEMITHEQFLAISVCKTKYTQSHRSKSVVTKVGTALLVDQHTVVTLNVTLMIIH